MNGKRAIAAASAVVALLLGGAIGYAAAPHLRIASAGDRAAAAFQTCVKRIPHPYRPIVPLTRDTEARRRAEALLQYQHDCAVSSGLETP